MSVLPYLFGLHFINMWIPYTYSHGLAFEESFGSPVYSIMIVTIYVLASIVIFFAFVGLFVTWKQYKQQLLTIYLLLALVILQNVLFYSDMRFRAPIEPILILLAGRASGGLFSSGWNWFHAHRQGKPTTPEPREDSKITSAGLNAQEVLSTSRQNGTMQQCFADNENEECSSKDRHVSQINGH